MPRDTRRGYNWSHRFPLIVGAVDRLKVRSALIDGEAVVCGQGRALPISTSSERKSKLANLLNNSGDGIYLNEHIAGDAVVFKHACMMGLEGVVSKRRDLPYRSGSSKCWLKIKKPASPAMLRVKDATP